MPPDGPGSTSFVVIRTDWSVLTALRALDATDATHVILAHRGASGDELHLFQADDIFYDLQTYATDAVLTSVLPLAEWPLTPTFAPGEAIGDETQAIVLDGGDPVGVVDLEAPGGGYPDPANVQPGDAGGPGGWTGEPVAPPVQARWWAVREATRHGWERRAGRRERRPRRRGRRDGAIARGGVPRVGRGRHRRVAARLDRERRPDRHRPRHRRRRRANRSTCSSSRGRGSAWRVTPAARSRCRKRARACRSSSSSRPSTRGRA